MGEPEEALEKGETKNLCAVFLLFFTVMTREREREREKERERERERVEQLITQI
jgi:hypothetical protein